MRWGEWRGPVGWLARRSTFGGQHDGNEGRGRGERPGPVGWLVRSATSGWSA